MGNVDSIQMLAILRRELRGHAAGDRLPTVRELMRRHGVSQSVVSQALAVLRQEGLIDAHVGRGTYVLGGNEQPKILWVCGLDVTQGEISPFYTHALRIGRELLVAEGFDVEPAWLASAAPDASRPYCTDDLAQRYAGLVFIGCRDEHALLNFAAWKRLPYVRLQAGNASSHEVVYSRVKRVREVLAFVQRQGVKRLAVLVDEHSEDPFLEMASIAGIQLDVLPYVVRRPWLSEFQWAGYQAVTDYLAGHPLPPALYVQDDIMAQGATRALRVHASAEDIERMHVIISTTMQTLAPFGIPASYLVFDIRDLMQPAIAQLQAQLAGREIGPVEPVGYRLLERPSVDELIAQTRKPA